MFRRKKAKFRGIFRGKFVEKLANFTGFWGEKSQTLRKNRPILRDFRRRKVKIRRKIGRFQRIFRGKLLEKLADVTGNFGGNFAKKQSVKNRSILHQYDQHCLTFFLTGIIICSFNNSSLKK